MEVSKKAQDALTRIKKNVQNSWQYYRKNYERFNFFRKFVFLTSLSDDDVSLLQSLKKPQIEFNVCEAYISRLLGEWSKQEPSISVMADDGAPVDPQLLQVIEGHIRHILFQANKNGCEYDVYKDQLSGGFSAYKVTTDYAHEMSFDQVIKLERVYDPTLCGFDQLAKNPTKSDGRYSFELYPMSKEDFIAEYPEIDISGLKFTREVEGFNWSYQNDREDVVLMCDYYEKKKKKVNIVKLANGQVLPLKKYEELVTRWHSEGRIAQPPVIVGKPRMTEMTTICRYIFMENKVIKYYETDYKYLPHVYVPGSDIMIREGVGGAVQQTTRPYVFHAKGMQQLKNFAGQTLANELENMVMHKWITAKEGLPQEEDYLGAWTDPQQASVLVYQAFMEDNPTQQVPPPREVQRIPTPPEVTNTFAMSDQVMQSILGSYDASLGINDNQLSGVAIVEGATQSNAAAMPYIVSHLEALTQVATIFIDLIPKYYVTPRTIPITGIDGEKSYVRINDKNPQQQQQGKQKPGMQTQGSRPLFTNYDENALQVKVEAGVNFQIQKARALQQIVALMQASPLFAQFMNTEGLPVLLDNIEIRGIDQLKLMSEGWMQQMKAMQQQQQQMAMQQASQPNPQVQKNQIEAAKLQQQHQQMLMEAKEHADQQQLDKESNAISVMKIHADLKRDADKLKMEQLKLGTDHALKIHDTRHKHEKETVETLHNISKDHKLHMLEEKKLALAAKEIESTRNDIKKEEKNL